MSCVDRGRSEPGRHAADAGGGERDSTVQIIEGDNAQAVVTPSAVAGIVSFNITNATGDNRSCRDPPNAARDDLGRCARRSFEQFVRTGSSDVIAVDDPPELGVVHGPDDNFTTTMLLAAGDYAVLLNVVDEFLEPVPGRLLDVALLTVEPGDDGEQPTPTLRFDRQATDYLIGDNLATAGPATIRVPRQHDRRRLRELTCRAAPRRHPARLHPVR